MDIFNLEDYQKEYLKISTKSGELKPFIPNIYQRELNKVIEEKKRHNEPIRLRILKCRQIGCSTWSSSFVYHACATDFNKSAMILAHDMDSSSGLFEMTKRFWDKSPEEIRPARKRSNAKELLFDKEDGMGFGSSIRIETANKLSAGRSKTLQYVHCSESAFWRDAATTFTGLLQSIPYKPGTFIVDESTANGVSGEGGQFYENWIDGGFTNIFFEWFRNPEYEIPTDSSFKPDSYEKELMARHPEITLAKLNFRRYKIHNELGSALVSPEDAWNQEYPTVPEDAFLSSGRPVFNSRQIQDDIKRVKQVKFIQGEI